MSRSRPPKCPNGRDCGVCLDHPVTKTRYKIKSTEDWKLALEDIRRMQDD